MQTKKCRACESAKSVEHFYVSRVRDGVTQYSPYCKPCHNKRSVVNTRARRYGMTAAQMNTMLDSADNCEICRRDLDREAVHFDHDHESGILRGMLCRECNLLLGYARDEMSTLAAAVRYLHRHQASG